MDKERERVIAFGANGMSVKQEDHKYFEEENPKGRIIWMKDIRKTSKYQNEITIT